MPGVCLLGVTDADFDAFDRVLEEALAAERFTCAVAAVGSSSGEHHRCVLGVADPERGQQATGATVFDMASVTKAVVTTTVVLGLVEDGRIALTDRVGRHLPVDGERADLTLKQLLTHTSGLQPYHFQSAWTGLDEARTEIFEESLLATAPDEQQEYSCLNFVHLAAVAEHVTKTPLPELAAEYVFEPAGMASARLGTPADSAESVAVTRDHEYGRDTVRGAVHDPIGNVMAGRSGNAGLFATIEDISRFAQTFLSDALGGTNRLLAPTTIDRLATDATAEGVEPHGLGWRLADGSLPAPTWSRHAVGHTGYTGTSLWLDLQRDRYCAILTNEVYTGKENSEMPRVRERAHGAAGAVPGSAFD